MFIIPPAVQIVGGEQPVIHELPFTAFSMRGITQIGDVWEVDILAFYPTGAGTIQYLSGRTIEVWNGEIQRI